MEHYNPTKVWSTYLVSIHLKVFFHNRLEYATSWQKYSRLILSVFTLEVLTTKENDRLYEISGIVKLEIRKSFPQTMKEFIYQGCER